MSLHPLHLSCDNRSQPIESGSLGVVTQTETCELREIRGSETRTTEWKETGVFPYPQPTLLNE
jgi:hypothetical protein